MRMNSASTGTAVPVWSGPCMSVWVPSPSCGASMIAPPVTARATPAAPRALPRARNAASSTSSV